MLLLYSTTPFCVRWRVQKKQKKELSRVCACACVRIICVIMRVLGIYYKDPKEVDNCGLQKTVLPVDEGSKRAAVVKPSSLTS